MTMDANIELGLTDTEKPPDGSYTSLKLLIMLEGGFSFSMGGIVVTTGAGAFVGEMVMLKSKSNAAAVDETDATIEEELASPVDTVVASVEVVIVLFAASVAVASVEVVVVVFAASVAVASVEV